MQGGIALIGFLLFLIVVLLTEKQEHRPRTLARMLGCGVLVLVIYNAGPFILGLLFIAGTSLGVRGIIVVLCVVFYGALLCRLAWEVWQDHRDNRAIRAGSEAAFDERVKIYMGTFGYDSEKAIAATKRIRDGGRRKTYRIRIKLPHLRLSGRRDKSPRDGQKPDTL